MATITLPPPLQSLADLTTHKARTQCVLDGLVKEGNGERYNEGFDAEVEDSYDFPDRTQTPFRNFCDWCKAHCAQLQPYSNNWELAATTAPEDSIWRKRVEAYRELLWMTNPGKPFAEFYFTADQRNHIMERNVFWPWVARTWRTLPEQVTHAFVAASSIRTLSVVTTWVENLWDTYHPQHDAIENEDIQPSEAPVVWSTFGKTKIAGPLDPQHIVHRNVTPYTLTLSGWHIPVYSSDIDNHRIRIYTYDSHRRVLFRIWLPKGGLESIVSMLQPVALTPVKKPHTQTPRVTRTPALPDTRIFHQDLLDCIAARHSCSTDLESIIRIIYSLRDDGIITTEDEEIAFIREYRAFCRK